MSAEQYNEGICTIPPEGWWCSRKPGHGGPCAARPMEEPDEGDLTAEEEAMIDAAWEKHKAAAPDSLRELIAAEIQLGDRYATADRIVAAIAKLSTDWTPEEIEDLLTDAIGDSFDMDWIARDGAKAIMRELAECGLEITLTAARRDLLANLPA